jgi:hypothetical protein
MGSPLPNQAREFLPTRKCLLSLVESKGLKSDRVPSLSASKFFVHGEALAGLLASSESPILFLIAKFLSGVILFH